MAKQLLAAAAGLAASLQLLTYASPLMGQSNDQRAVDLLDVVATARGLGTTPVKDGGGAPPVADADGDGVANDGDSCPDTAEGEAVDSEGCSVTQREAVVRQVYEDEVNPLILRADGGCTNSGCHGNSSAPGGLELYGAGTPDSTQLNYDSMIRYINNNSADRLTTKISGGLGHGGGTRYPTGSTELATISDWAISVEALPQ